jgi:hypothetical protein
LLQATATDHVVTVPRPKQVVDLSYLVEQDAFQLNNILLCSRLHVAHI